MAARARAAITCYAACMTPRTAALAITLTRTAFGAALLAAPRTLGRSWIGEDADRPAARTVVQAVGARDIGIGAGGAIALARGGDPKTWLAAGAAADVADCVITLRSFRHLPAPGRFLALAFALCAAYASVRTAAALGAAEEGRAADAFVI